MAFDPANAVLLVADDVSSLRRCDVFRLLDWYETERAALVAYLRRERPDLGAEVDAVLAELV